MIELTDLIPAERTRRDGVWCDLVVPRAIGGGAGGRIKLLPSTSIPLATRRRELMDAGASALDAMRGAYAEVGVIEVEGFTLRGEAICDKRELIKEFVETFQELFLDQIVAASYDLSRYDAGESMPPAIGHDAADTPQPEG